MPSHRRVIWIWIVLAFAWIALCAAFLRPDQPASLLMSYCTQAGGLLACERRATPASVLIPPPNLVVAEQDLLFFALVALGTPLLVLAMGRAARWAASGGEVEE